MCSNSIAEFAKFRSSIVLLTEAETHLGHFLIDLLHSVVVLQEVETLFVRLPDELQPWSQHVTIGTILLRFTTDRAQQETRAARDARCSAHRRFDLLFRCLQNFQIIDVHQGVRCFFSSSRATFLTFFQISHDDIFQRFHRYLKRSKDFMVHSLCRLTVCDIVLYWCRPSLAMRLFFSSTHRSSSFSINGSCVFVHVRWRRDLTTSRRVSKARCFLPTSISSRRRSSMRVRGLPKAYLHSPSARLRALSGFIKGMLDVQSVVCILLVLIM